MTLSAYRICCGALRDDSWKLEDKSPLYCVSALSGPESPLVLVLCLQIAPAWVLIGYLNGCPGNRFCLLLW